MHKVRKMGPGSEGVSGISGTGLIRTRDALKGNSTGSAWGRAASLHGRMLQLSGEVAASTGVFFFELCQTIGQICKTLVSMGSLLLSASSSLYCKFLSSVFHHLQSSHCHHVSICHAYLVFVLYLFI